MTIRDEPEHWDALARRVTAAAVEDSKRGGFDWLANSRPGWIVACLLIAAVLTFTVRSAQPSNQVSQLTPWAEMLAPADKVGQAIVVPTNPPSIAALVVGDQGERPR